MSARTVTVEPPKSLYEPSSIEEAQAAKEAFQAELRRVADERQRAPTTYEMARLGRDMLALQERLTVVNNYIKARNSELHNAGTLANNPGCRTKLRALLARCYWHIHDSGTDEAAEGLLDAIEAVVPEGERLVADPKMVYI